MNAWHLFHRLVVRSLGKPIVGSKRIAMRRVFVAAPLALAHLAPCAARAPRARPIP